MKGRKKKPEYMLKLAGTERADRPRNSKIGEPVTAIEDIEKLEPVKNLPAGRSKRIFHEVVAGLIKWKALEAVDVYELVQYAILYDKWLAAVEVCASEPRFSKTYDENGNVSGFIENPYFKDLKTLPREINSIGSRFGFSPADRMRFNAKREEEKKTLIDILDTDYEEVK